MILEPSGWLIGVFRIASFQTQRTMIITLMELTGITKEPYIFPEVGNR